ncbi:unnamed protein product [Urochloa humidicola]
MDDAVEGLGAANGHATWTSAMSTFVLKYLSNVVASGAKTAKGFKKCYYNACARALNDKFSTSLSGDQISNHMKKWQKRWKKIIKLKKLSAAGFDEDNHIITLDAEHYNNHIADHKADEEYLNKPLLNYAEMETIFGNSMATGRFAKDSSADLGTEEDDEVEAEAEEGNGNGVSDGRSNSCEQGASSNPRKAKKAKIMENAEEGGLIGAFNKVGDKLAAAITEVAKSNNQLPEDLFAQVNSLSISGFDGIQISMYFAHLVGNPQLATAFCSLPFENKIHLMAMFVSEKFPGQQ